ncbi:MAG TPA: hypothetical protein VHC22_08330 [Pirellulales bacterium]|nr:hypothetical protein [Pirellulales bacterium]
MPRFIVFVAFSLLAVLSESALAQQREDLVIENLSDQPMKAWIMARGGPRPDKTWRPERTIPPGRWSIQLPCCDPFDIAIGQPDGTSQVYRGVNLRSAIQQCRNATDWSQKPAGMLAGSFARWDNGHYAETQPVIQAPYFANRTHFEIQIVRHDSPWPEPPQPDRPPRPKKPKKGSA